MPDSRLSRLPTFTGRPESRRNGGNLSQEGLSNLSGGVSDCRANYQGVPRWACCGRGWGFTVWGEVMTSVKLFTLPSLTRVVWTDCPDTDKPLGTLYVVSPFIRLIAWDDETAMVLNNAGDDMVDARGQIVFSSYFHGLDTELEWNAALRDPWASDSSRSTQWALR